MPEKGREVGSGREPRDIAKGTQKIQQLPNLLKHQKISFHGHPIMILSAAIFDKLLSSRSFPRLL